MNLQPQGWNCQQRPLCHSLFCLIQFYITIKHVSIPLFFISDAKAWWWIVTLFFFSISGYLHLSILNWVRFFWTGQMEFGPLSSNSFCKIGTWPFWFSFNLVCFFKYSWILGWFFGWFVGADRLKARSSTAVRRESSGLKDEPAVDIKAQTFTFRELAAATNNFRSECLLGEGGFGRVYKGRMESTGQVNGFSCLLLKTLNSFLNTQALMWS